METGVAEGLLTASEARRAAIKQWFDALRPGMTVALSTHINADGDGCGSETALARLLAQSGMACRIVNPTPWPSMFQFLLGDDVTDLSSRGAAALDDIDALVVLDINDRRRLGHLAERVRSLTVPISVIDHHIAGDEPVGTLAITDTSACATGELVYDIAMALELEITPAIAQSLYAAILTDTGSFRYSNTSPRAHAIASQLLAAGVDPEEMYRRIYAQVSVGRLQLLREALGSLEVERTIGLSWISVAADAMERFGVTSEDLDGIVEHPRSITGTRLALFFRDLGHGKVKVSFRSAGQVDVQQFARRYGGGGHAKASGALMVGDLASVRSQVLSDARHYLASPGSPSTS
jgi:bifunctional oligoribonuclease and PAP phosphatase NrnA